MLACRAECGQGLLQEANAPQAAGVLAGDGSGNGAGSAKVKVAFAWRFGAARRAFSNHLSLFHV
jgi:hypothetical protein